MREGKERRVNHDLWAEKSKWQPGDEYLIERLYEDIELRQEVGRMIATFITNVRSRELSPAARKSLIYGLLREFLQ